jgi:hypothetical protein
VLTILTAAYGRDDSIKLNVISAESDIKSLITLCPLGGTPLMFETTVLTVLNKLFLTQPINLSNTIYI